MNVLAEIKKDDKTAADWLLHYPFRKTQYYRDRMELINGGTQESESGIHGSMPGNPTAQRALKLTSILETEKWLETIELVETIFSDKRLIFLQHRREAAHMTKNVAGKPAWVLYVQRQYAESMAQKYGRKSEEYWVSEATLKRWWSQMVTVTARVAEKMGCL